MKRILGAVLVGGLTASGVTLAVAQDAPPAAETPAPPAAETPPAPPAQTPPAESGQSVPEVEVIQEQTPPQPKPKPAAAKPKPKPKPQPQQQAAPASQPEPVPQPPPVAEAPPPPPGPTEILPNSPYGSPAASGAAQRASQSATTPSNPTQLIPTNLEGFSGAATNLAPEALEAKQPRNVNEALTGVPGVTIINDDANAHHGGVSVRGSPARRSRKVLVMEDGHANNLALWLDPSVHYWGPVDRFESIEVLRGTVITHGPNNNFGVVNARNLSPFGPAETVISSAIGFTRTNGGTFLKGDLEADEDGNLIYVDDDGDPTDPEVISKKGTTDLSYRWHVHTRQNSDNVGIVASYTGANVQGAWDTEQLRFHDFYGAIGWKGSSSDLVVSSMYARQKDNYDEQNFLGEAELDEEDAEEIAAAVAGFAENQFKLLKNCKTCYAPAAGLNNYNGEIWRGQIVHNAYIDDDTTITSRVYAQYHRRDRYQLNTFDAAPDGSPGGDEPVFDPLDLDPNEESTILFGEDSMFGRLRTFRHIGAEIRGEWANQNILGFNHTIQAGIRYEYQDMTNRNFIGLDNEILKDGDEAGATIFDRELDSNAVSAFLQTNVKVAQDFNVVPGIRFEWYQASRINRVVAREESEAGGGEDCTEFNGTDEECLDVGGIILNPDPATEKYSNFHALPGVSFAYTGLNRTTIFGGYHRGMSTAVLRNEDFPVDDEIGNNFNLGLRSTAIKGLEFEAVGFYQLLSDYQFGASFSDTADRSFGRADEVEISGVELFGRLNSQPFTGGSMNFYGEANYLYTRGVFKDASEFDDDGNVVGDFNGNRIPEVPLHVAAFTLGVQQTTGWRWDASVTATYRGAFFTDEGNTPFGVYEPEEEDGEFEIEEAGEDGEVPSVWLLSARANLDIGNTGASVFISGDNLTNEFYISDREDGMKPGLGRTIWTGFKYKF